MSEILPCQTEPTSAPDNPQVTKSISEMKKKKKKDLEQEKKEKQKNYPSPLFPPPFPTQTFSQ